MFCILIACSMFWVGAFAVTDRSDAFWVNPVGIATILLFLMALGHVVFRWLGL